MTIWEIYLILCHILSIFAFIYMLSEKQRTPTSIIAWILSFAFLPYIAVPLYFFIGIRKRKVEKKPEIEAPSALKNKKFKSKRTIPKLFENYGLEAITSAHFFELYHEGIQAYEAFIAAIKNAKKTIYISTYVLKNDVMTKKLLIELKKKAKEGVEIKILADSVGSWQLYFNYFLIKRIRKSGIDLRFFMPIFKNPFKNEINLRNHRKIYLVDDEIVFTGGMNLGNEYMGPKPCNKRWEDLLFCMKGNVVMSFHNIFVNDWRYTTDETLACAKSQNTEEKHLVQVAPSGPDIERDVLYNAILNQIYLTNHRLWIMTPYFIPSNELVRALIVAKRRGVDVKIITPLKSNHTMADIGRSSYLQRMNDAGVELCLFEGKMVHAKAILFDDVVMLGSVNIDYRSLFLNYELGVFFYSDDIIKEIELWMKSFIESVHHDLENRGKFKQFLGNIMKVFVPLL